MQELVLPGSKVLEVGYGDGLLSCYLCQELGWHMVGLDVEWKAHNMATQNAEKYNLTDVVFFHNAPCETRRHRGLYDAVFIKTVLYSSPNMEEYTCWLDWILSVLKPGGILINFETGKANALTQCYRRIRRRSYTDLCLYTRKIEALYDSRFKIIDRQYYGGFSQYFAPLPVLYSLASQTEEKLSPRHADNSFIVSIIGRKV